MERAAQLVAAVLRRDLYELQNLRTNPSSIQRFVKRSFLRSHNAALNALTGVSDLPVFSPLINKPINPLSPTWIFNPIDGLENFSRSLPLFCSSFALVQNNAALAALIHHPPDNLSLLAAPGHGAFLQDVASSNIRARIQPYDHNSPPLIAVHQSTPPNTLPYRTLGSLSLSFSYLAQGILDAVVCPNSPETAAGALIAQEAGAVVSSSPQLLVASHHDAQNLIKHNLQNPNPPKNTPSKKPQTLDAPNTPS